MKITTFNNNKGLIHGNDPKRIGCAMGGVLRIGATEVNISPEADSVLPLLFNGGTGNYYAVFASKSGMVYDLGEVEVRGGRITPPHPTAVEIMELRCRADETDRKYERLMAEVERLANIFDTNSLNFLIR